jgi:outer membrane lipoprotein carrier protein
MRPAFLVLLPALLCGGVIGTTPAVPAPRGAEPAPRAAADPLIARLQAKMQRLESLSGRFVQRLESRGLGRARVESGRFAIRKPASMRWEYEKPEKKLAVTDGETTWLHLPEDNEVHVGRYPQGGGAAASSLLAGQLRLDEDFSARRLTAGEAGPQGAVGAVVIRLEPIEPREEFEALLVAVDPHELSVRRLTLLDAIGGRMSFEFFDLVEDAVLDDALFRFEMPPGVEVLDTR